MEAGQRQQQSSRRQCSLGASQRLDAVSEIVSSILDGCWAIIDGDLRLQEQLNRFSKFTAIRNINQISTIDLHRIQELSILPPAGQEPQPLIQDSLLPISVEIQRGYFQSKKPVVQLLPSQISNSPRKKEKSPNQIAECQKLDISSQQEDKFVIELRKMQEEKVQKLIANQRLRKAQAQFIAAKIRSKGFEKMTFDFSGCELRVKNQPKNNLVSMLVNPQISSHTRKVKEAFDDLNPTTVDDTLCISKRKSLLNQTRRKEEVQFNHDQSLFESIELCNGSRCTFEGKILEAKKTPQSSIYQLKLQIEQGKKLSRSEFQKLRARNGTIFSPEKAQKQTNNPSGQFFRSSSLPVLPKIKAVKPDERIFVNSDEHRTALLEGNQEPAQKQVSQTIKLKEVQIPLGKIDIFNIKYLRSRNQQIDQRDGYVQQTKYIASLPSIKSGNLTKQALRRGRVNPKEGLNRNNLQRTYECK